MRAPKNCCPAGPPFTPASRVPRLPAPCSAPAEQFRDYFSQYGEVVEAQIMQDHMSGRSRGFG